LTKQLINDILYPLRKLDDHLSIYIREESPDTPYMATYIENERR